MVDLATQYQEIKSEINSAIQEVLDSSMYIGGPIVQRFQKSLESYLDVKHVIPCANGTDALQIAMMALGLKPGDEVITPSFTYIATTEVIALLGLTPVFVDVDPQTFCIDPAKIEAAITSKTKAIVPVHLYGQGCDMDAIMKIAKEHNLFVIEDNAQAIGSDFHSENGEVKKLGTIGDIGCTSFFPSKNLGCYGDGGAIMTNNDELADQLRMVANHGQKVKYVHDVVGCNSRLDAVQAAVLNVKLPRLNSYIDARIKVADFYDRVLGVSDKITTPFRDGKSKHVFHQYTVQLNGVDRDALQEYLASKEIPSMIYYPIPAHKQGMFESFNVTGLDLPVTDELTKNVISFPIHTEMTEEQQNFICSEILHFVNGDKA
ncbi:UDP-2-acetamido-2-deoxy-3-oxo-D-glucuronate aminotransferase [compost metagenome]